MYKRLSAILFPVMTLLLIGSVVWGYQENQEKNAILIKAENQYQRAFHDLSFHVDRLHNELGNTLTLNSASVGAQRKGLVNVWRITSEAQNEISQLPVTMLPFNKTEEFLSRISKFSYQASVRDLTKSPLTEKEMKNLKQLHQSAEEIAKDLQGVQDKVIGNRLRWMDVETTLATAKQGGDSTIIDGFKQVDKKVGEYPELDWGPTISNLYTRRSVKKIGEKPITQDEIMKKAAQFTGVKDHSSIKVTENGRGTEWASYRAKIDSGKDGQYATLDYTRNGGHLISFNYERTLQQPKLSYAEAKQQADGFLKSKGYDDVVAVSYDQFGEVGNFTYASTRDGVVVYPEKISLRVALDNGQVTGMQASDYVYEKDNGVDIPKAKLTAAQAKKYLNPDFKVNYDRLALIKNDMSEEVLTYEFGGEINKTQYRIYINADNGNEENIERVKNK